MLISETTRAQTLVTPEQTEIEWNKIEKKVRSLMKKMRSSIMALNLVYSQYFGYIVQREILTHITYTSRISPENSRTG